MQQPGAIIWQDLTVPNAEAIRDFYSAVAGWEAKPEHMGEYADFNMLLPGGETPVAGICHARGVNAELPPVWLVYITVEDVEAATEKVRQLGGKVLAGPRKMGNGILAVIQDPAGAICALFQA